MGFTPVCGCGSKPIVPFWARCTTHFRTYFSGDWDVHWGLTDLGFDPWPFGSKGTGRGFCAQCLCSSSCAAFFPRQGQGRVAGAKLISVVLGASCKEGRQHGLYFSGPCGGCKEGSCSGPFFVVRDHNIRFGGIASIGPSCPKELKWAPPSASSASTLSQAGVLPPAGFFMNGVGSLPS